MPQSPKAELESGARTVVALLHPGAMGARIGAELVRAGHEVRWLDAGRSSATRRRADAAGLTSTGDVAALLTGTRVVVSVCPPQGALDVASVVAGGGFSGTYVDANPVSAATLSEITATVQGPGPRSSTAASSAHHHATADSRTSTWLVTSPPRPPWQDSSAAPT